MSIPSHKILVALSGGVDSAVAALRLRQAGADVSAAYIRTWAHEEDVFGDCPAGQDIADAEAVSQKLGIPFEVVNLVEEYRRRIVEYMVEGYRSGVTPNPDVLCNREIKFGVFLDWAVKQGFESVATGHYAQVLRDEATGRARIFEGRDKNKDQSYFLAMMRPEQAEAARFPIGDLPKPEVRALAEAHGLPVARKKDSQGICFLGQVRINDFLREFIEDKPGPIINAQGSTLGEHPGLHHFTLGQRKGIGVPSNTDNKAYVVVEKRFADNALIVDFDGPTTEGLWHQTMPVRGVSWLAEPRVEACDLLARPRYRDPAVPAQWVPSPGTSGALHFIEPQRALAPGQVVAFYAGEELLGGGFYS